MTDPGRWGRRNPEDHMKRLIAGGVTLLAAAAIPLGSAFAVKTPPRQCRLYQATFSANSTQDQTLATYTTNPRAFQALQTRASGIESVNDAGGCPT